ncbi:flagellar hook-basal body complex protein FliE [Parerythrobacter jejuensis]|uniref:Flagellar hook-basal body complex protein FliE n=1 Tax=Parerythrobacter jejuensis TaxID=795812 RepID=A0A845AK21_9SPHN|nr:flagellar hook-basal body complex protein FliE [Parerythrobacter jejuensis]MXP30610.1 flagellar hook-basal body complex protein FliE [Parerythrobacter jejuensis]MXP33370.1 flagellar hook-basal body complex protein FliE [Parerythrobacter jejuensis]
MNSVGTGNGLQQVIALRQQILDRSNTLQELRQPGEKPDVAGAGSDGPDFAGTLKSAVQEVSAAQSRSSELAAAYERGEVTDIAQVMLARQESGVAFEATLQVRNKLLSAYQDIMRMGA